MSKKEFASLSDAPGAVFSLLSFLLSDRRWDIAALRPSWGGPVIVPDGQALGSARERSASGHANHPREPLSARDRPDPGGPP